MKKKEKKLLEKLEKEDIIKDLIEEYSKPMKVGKQTFEHSEKDINDYRKELETLKLKQLKVIGQYTRQPPKFGLIGTLVKKLKRRKAILVRIYHKNNSYTDYITGKYTRTIQINEFKYIMPPNYGVQDNKYEMTCYTFYENNPFPLEFRDDRPIACPDAELMEATLHFEFAQKMAKVTEMTQKINLALVFSILSFGCSAAILIIQLQEMGVF